MLEQLRQRLRALEKPAGIGDGPAALPLGIVAVDAALGGGLARGALHEIAAAERGASCRGDGFCARAGGSGGDRRATHTPFTSPMGRGERKKSVIWIAEDMALAESGTPYGPGLDAFGLAPERLLTVSVARPRDLLWAMEEALRCRAVGAVIGEVRDSAVARWRCAGCRSRRRKAARSHCCCARRRRTRPPPPPRDGSSAPRRMIVFAAQLVRNRRGLAGSWILEWSDSDECFLLATHAQPVAAPALDRPHRQIARQVA